MKLTNEFQSIRQWATDRGIFESGDPKTQFTKLAEEQGELAQAILKGDSEAAADAIGDMTVVLVNLAHLMGMNYEICVNGAFQQIKDRKGKMVDGTFVKQT